jgi:hypothetical protein
VVAVKNTEQQRRVISGVETALLLSLFLRRLGLVASKDLIRIKTQNARSRQAISVVSQKKFNPLIINDLNHIDNRLFNISKPPN